MAILKVYRTLIKGIERKTTAFTIQESKRRFEKKYKVSVSLETIEAIDIISTKTKINYQS